MKHKLALPSISTNIYIKFTVILPETLKTVDISSQSIINNN